jgi:hypothetical protein
VEGLNGISSESLTESLNATTLALLCAVSFGHLHLDTTIRCVLSERFQISPGNSNPSMLASQCEGTEHAHIVWMSHFALQLLA